MQIVSNKINYLLVLIFWLIGVFLLLTGAWNIVNCLATEAPITSAVIAMFFLLLFAVISITYSIFLFRRTRAGTTQHLFAWVSPVKVLSLLAFAVAPLFFIYFSAGNREYNLQRQAAFQEMQPALLQYVADHGKSPKALHLLVPEYLPVIPEIITLDENVSPAKRVRYVPSRKTARFYYRTYGSQQSEEYYEIANDQ